MKLIFGLGNPGKKYSQTRHNLGFMVLDQLAKEEKLNQTLLIKPQTFVNNSGLVVAKKANFYKTKPQDIWVIHDDLDLPIGEVKVKSAGGSAGHKGVESIINQLATDEFNRIRIGIGRPNPGVEPEDFVLAKFTSQEKPKIKIAIQKAVQIIKDET